MFSSNLAQVLTSLAEASTERRSTVNARADGVRNLQEALEFFQRCFTLQEYQLTQNKDLQAYTVASPLENLHPSSEFDRDHGPDWAQEEVWVAIEEPVTKDSLIDTMIAQLGGLTTVCNLVNADGDENINWIEEYYREMLQDRIDLYSNDSERLDEIILTKAKFSTAYADASFHGGIIDVLTYERELNAAFQDLALATSKQGLCDRAEARMLFNTSIAALHQSNANTSEADYSQLNDIRWTHGMCISEPFLPHLYSHLDLR